LKSFKIGKKNIGENYPCFLVAELSGNHGGKISNALKLIKAAKQAGADAVKLQSYTPESMTLNSSRKDFLIKSQNKKWEKYQTYWDIYLAAQTPISWHKKLFEYSKKIGIEIFSSPFDIKAVDLLESLNCPAYKIASPEINHFPLIERVAKTKKPIILSKGLASEYDIKEALKILRKYSCTKIAILQCTTSYPCKYKEINLSLIPQIKKKFKVVSGFSDHSIGNAAAIASIALGSKIIEKHFTILPNTVDSFFSASAESFKNMTKSIREAELAIGSKSFDLTKSAKKNLSSKRSIYIAENIFKGSSFNEKNLKIVRPFYGLNPKYYKNLINKKAYRNFKAGDRFTIVDFKKTK
jgi:pseudaminic acid synthase